MRPPESQSSETRPVPSPPPRGAGWAATGAVLLITLLLGILFIARVPPWNIPDEPTHLDCALAAAGRGELQPAIIRSMAEHGFWDYLGLRAPHPLPESFAEIRFLALAGAVTQAGRKPPLYYRAAGSFLRFFPAAAPVDCLYLLRAFSLGFHLLGAVFVFLAARRLCPGERFYPAAAAGAFALLPQSLLIGVSVSYEPLLDCLAAVLLWLAVRLQAKGADPLGAVALVLVAFLAPLTSTKGFFLLPGAFLGLVLAFLGGGRRRASLAAVAAVLAAALAGWVLLAWLRPGLVARLGSELGREMARLRGVLAGDSLPAWRRYPWFHREVFSSFFFKGGWGMFPLPPWAFWIFVACNFFAVLGQFPLVARLDGPSRRAWLAAVVVGLGVVAGFYLTRAAGPDPVPQGRHLLVGAPAWALLFTGGLVALFPARARGWAAGVIACLWPLAAAAVLFLLLGPIYAGGS